MLKAFPQMAYMMGGGMQGMQGMNGMPTMASMGAMPGMGGMAAMPMGAMAGMPMSAMAAMPGMGAMQATMGGMPAMGGMGGMPAMGMGAMSYTWMPTSMGMQMVPVPMSYPAAGMSGMPMMPMSMPYPAAMSMMPMSMLNTPYGPMPVMAQPGMPTTNPPRPTAGGQQAGGPGGMASAVYPPMAMAMGPSPAMMMAPGGGMGASPAMMMAPGGGMGPASMMMMAPASSAGASSGVVVGGDGPPSGDCIQSPDGSKRKRPSRPYVKPVRTVRPKFTQQKGVQCQGMNAKKQARCRNAALMEYIGEQPVYCAEHIEQDPDSLYCKCKAPFRNKPGDNKRCKEVVLKDFEFCYKHYGLAVRAMVGKEGYILACSRSDKLASVLSRLCEEASAAKKADGDMYQRKSKLIGKLQQMYTVLNTHVTNLGSQLMKEAERNLENVRNMHGEMQMVESQQSAAVAGVVDEVVHIHPSLSSSSSSSSGLGADLQAPVMHRPANGRQEQEDDQEANGEDDEGDAIEGEGKHKEVEREDGEDGIEAGA
jgi:hypothetical protein